MASEKYTVEQVINAIKGSRGIKETIRQRLGCDRHTVDNYLARHPTVKQAYDNEIELIGDVAENVIINSIRDGNVDTAKWYAVKKLRNRGYGDKTEMELSGIVELTVKGYANVNPDEWPEDKADSNL